MQITHLSRRRFLTGAVASATLAAAGEGLLFSQQTITSSTPDVVAVPQTDPGYFSMLAKYFPGLTAAGAFEPFSQSIGLFINKTDKAIYACASSWSITGTDGTTHTLCAHHLAHSGHRISLGLKRRRLITGRMSIVQPGDPFVVSPLFLAAPKSYAAFIRKQGSPDALFGHAIERRKRLSARLLAISDPIAMSLNAVIHEQGKIIASTDNAAAESLKRHFFTRRNAEQDEAAIILKRIQVGDTQAQLIERLERHAARGKRRTSDGKHKTYSVARATYARHLLHHLKEKDVARTQQLLVSVSQSKRRIPT